MSVVRRSCRACLVGAFFASLVQSGCVGRTCGLVGCQDIERLEFSVPRGGGDIVAELCRKDACGRAPLSGTSLQGEGRFSVEVEYEGPSTSDPFALTCVSANGAAQSVCTVSWLLQTPEHYVKGDELSVRLSAGDEELSYSSGRVSTASLYYPDGEECGGACEDATVSLRD